MISCTPPLLSLLSFVFLALHLSLLHCTPLLPTFHTACTRVVCLFSGCHFHSFWMGSPFYIWTHSQDLSISLSFVTTMGTFPLTSLICVHTHRSLSSSDSSLWTAVGFSCSCTCCFLSLLSLTSSLHHLSWLLSLSHISTRSLVTLPFSLSLFHGTPLPRTHHIHASFSLFVHLLLVSLLSLYITLTYRLLTHSTHCTPASLVSGASWTSVSLNTPLLYLYLAFTHLDPLSLLVVVAFDLPYTIFPGYLYFAHTNIWLDLPLYTFYTFCLYLSLSLFNAVQAPAPLSPAFQHCLHLGCLSAHTHTRPLLGFSLERLSYPSISISVLSFSLRFFGTSIL